MHLRFPLALGVPLVALLVWLPAAAPGEPAAAAPAPSAGVRLSIESPTAGSVVKSKLNMAELRGRASAAGEADQRFDVMIVLDVSRSTSHASGADVDGDGVVGEDPQLGLYAPGEYPAGVRSTDPGDTILKAEVQAARTLLEGLDPRRVRVGLITFSGAVDPDTGRQVRRDQQDATLRLPLTSDTEKLHRTLDEIGAEPPHGATDFAAGIRLATRELSGMSGARSQPRPHARRVMLFLTDGIPSFPVGLATVSDAGDLEAAVNAAKVARAAEIRINTYALGTDALTRPKAATEVARVTLGTFTPVLEPGAIAAALNSVSFANIEDVGVVNLTTHEDAPDVRLNPDGSFQAFVPVRVGTNRVLVNALASDGSQANLELEFSFQMAQSDDRSRERELARLRKLNDELLRHMEAERIKRAKRRQRMEHQVEIRAERPE